MILKCLLVAGMVWIVYHLVTDEDRPEVLEKGLTDSLAVGSIYNTGPKRLIA